MLYCFLVEQATTRRFTIWDYCVQTHIWQYLAANDIDSTFTLWILQSSQNHADAICAPSLCFQQQRLI